jgi:hypothetical protein
MNKCRVSLSALVKSEDQPRDEQGRWTDGGSSTSFTAKPAAKKGTSTLVLQGLHVKRLEAAAAAAVASMKSAASPAQAAKAFNQAKAESFAQFSADFKQKEQAAEQPKEVSAADVKMMEALASGIAYSSAAVQRERDIEAARLAGGKTQETAVKAVLDKAPSPPARTAEVGSLADSLAGGASSKFVGGMSRLQSALLDGSDEEENSINAVRSLRDNLKGSPNFQALKAATGINLEGRLVDRWGVTSNGDNLSTAVQFAVRDAFSLQDTRQVTSGDPADAERRAYAGAAKELGVKIDTPEQLDTLKKGLQEFAHGQYRATQSYLASKGIKDVYVARGMRSSVNQGEASEVDLALQPASSFTADMAIAKQFAGKTGTVYLVKVPASQVLGTYRTGYGETDEHEVVLLGGGTTKAAAVNSAAITGRNLMSSAAQAAAAIKPKK